MTRKTDKTEAAHPQSPNEIIAHLQEAGFGNMMGMSSAWLDALGKMGAEMATFVADRVKEDVKTQQDLMGCKTVEELQHVQAQFVQKAMKQYQEETGKLVEIGTRAFAQKQENQG
ncbi:MAG: phasin family protein [Sulfitobacter sp.]|nr:phasin family protein [Sulfitobacter sp.]